MKRHFYLILILSIFNLSNLLSQEEIEWSEKMTISSTTNIKSPVIGLLNGGIPAAIWGTGSTIFFSRMIDGEFSEPIPIETGMISPDIYSFGGLDMAIKDNQIHIVFENFSNGIFLIRSIDGGNSFEEPVNVVTPEPGKWATLSSVSIDDNGNPLVSVILENTNETEGRYVMMRSLDGGQSFNAPIIASEPADGDYVCECCPSDIYTKGQDVWLVFRNNDNNQRDMWVTKSTNGGDSFEEALDIDATDWVLNACPISGPRIAPLAEDSLVSIWTSGVSGTNKVSISIFDGNTMEGLEELKVPQNNENAQQTNPTIAGANNIIGLVWEENGFGENGTDLLFAFSKNGKNGLLANIANITEETGAQKYPSLVYAYGQFHLIYTESTGGLTYKNGHVSVTESFSNINLASDCIQAIDLGEHIQLKSECSIENNTFNVQLFSLNGKQIAQWENQQFINKELNLNHQSIRTGLYLLSIDSKQSHWSSKIMIER